MIINLNLGLVPHTVLKQSWTHPVMGTRKEYCRYILIEALLTPYLRAINVEGLT